MQIVKTLLLQLSMSYNLFTYILFFDATLHLHTYKLPFKTLRKLSKNVSQSKHISIPTKHSRFIGLKA